MNEMHRTNQLRRIKRGNEMVLQQRWEPYINVVYDGCGNSIVTTPLPHYVWRDIPIIDNLNPLEIEEPRQLDDSHTMIYHPGDSRDVNWRLTSDHVAKWRGTAWQYLFLRE